MPTVAVRMRQNALGNCRPIHNRKHSWKSRQVYMYQFCNYVALPYLTFGYLQKFLKIRDGYVMAANPSFFKQEVQCWNTYKLWTINKYWCLFCQKSQIFHHNTLFDWWGICIYLYIYIFFGTRQASVVTKAMLFHTKHTSHKSCSGQSLLYFTIKQNIWHCHFIELNV